MSVQGPAAEAFIEQVRRAMDVISRRQQLVASNVGNIDTPGYKTVDLDFDKALTQAVSSGPGGGLALRTTDPRHIAGGATHTPGASGDEVDGLAVRPDGNNVSLDREMLNLAQTRHRYDIAANSLRTRLRLLKFAIMEGKAG